MPNNYSALMLVLALSATIEIEAAPTDWVGYPVGSEIYYSESQTHGNNKPAVIVKKEVLTEVPPANSRTTTEIYKKNEGQWVHDGGDLYVSLRPDELNLKTP